MSMRRFFVVAALAAPVAMAVACTLGGLDADSAGWGQRDGAAAEASGDGCVAKCAPGVCGDDGCGGTCGCGTGEGCVDAKCFPCAATWHTSNLSNALSFDAKRNYIYTSTPVDGGAAFATVNACTGQVITARTPAKSTAGIDPIPSTNELVQFGEHLYTRSYCSYALDSGTCVFRYDAVTNTVDTRGPIAMTDPNDELWNLTVTSSGKVFGSGKYAAQGVARIVPMTPDLVNCGGTQVSAGTRGGAIGASGDDVYQVLYTGTAGQLRLAHFVGSSCATTNPCTCAPADVSPTLTLPIANPTPEPGTYFLQVQDGVVYVVGVQSITTGSLMGAGFVAAFDTKANKWTPAYVYTPSAYAKLDGLLRSSVTPDGKLLYVVGAKAAFSPGSTGVLLRFDLPFPSGQAPVPNGEISVAGLTIVWDVKVASDAVYVAGAETTTPGVGPQGISKCSLALACN